MKGSLLEIQCNYSGFSQILCFHGGTDPLLWEVGQQVMSGGWGQHICGRGHGF